MIITTSYKFKILPIDLQKEFLNDYFLRFARAVNFFIKKIPIIETIQSETYEFIKNGLNGKCSYCGKKYKICENHKPEGKNQRDRNKLCKECNQNALLNRRKKNTKELVCQKCWNKEFSIRKILYATRGRKRSIYGDIRDAVKLPGTEYALAFKRASDTLKARKRQLSRVVRNIKFKDIKLKEWQEVLENFSVPLKSLIDRYKNNKSFSEIINSLKSEYKRKDIPTRFTLPREKGQKVYRYKHIVYKNNPSKGKTESQIKRVIDSLNKTIEKLNKRLKETKINFRGTIVDLQNTAIRNINLKDIELNIDGRTEKLAIAVKNVKSQKSKKWLSEVINRIKKGEARYPLLIRKNDTFYLSYPVRYELQEPLIPSKTRIMGIDRGVNQLAVTAIIDKPNDIPHHIKFYSGKDLMRNKIKYQLIRKKFTGTKSVNKRRAKFGKKVDRISNYLLHVISRQIVNQAQELQPVVIAMEDLKIIPGEKRPKRGTAVREKKIRFKLNNFTYGKLRDLIVYKAALAYVPVRFVKPEYTSQTCYRCCKTGERSKGFFKCNNCGLKINADLNAAINIAKSLDIKSG